MNDQKKKSSVIKEQPEAYNLPEESYLPPLIEERYEIIDGIRYDMLPSPTFKHQVLVTHLWNQIYSTCSMNGAIVVAPMDVHLDENNIVQPDLIYVSNENSQIIKTRIEGVPDLLVEILSPSTGEHDKVRKRALYERFGVPEYWIVDVHHRTIDQFVLLDGKYLLERTYGSFGTLLTSRFPCISIDLNQLFQILDKYGG